MSRLTRIGNHTIVATAAHDFINLVRGANINLQKILDIDALGLVFVNGQIVVRRYKEKKKKEHFNI